MKETIRTDKAAEMKEKIRTDKVAETQNTIRAKSKNTIRQRVKKITAIMLVVTMVLGVYAFPGAGLFSQLGAQVVYASTDLRADVTNAQMLRPGERGAQITITVRNNNATTAFSFSEVTATGDLQGVTVTQITPIAPSTYTIDPNSEINLRMFVDLSHGVQTGIRTFNLIFDGNVASPVGPLFLFIGDEEAILPPPPEIPDAPRVYRPAADFSHTLGVISGFSHGSGNVITFHAINRGDTPILNAEFTIELPDGMSVYNMGLTSFVGTHSIGQRVGRTFHIMVHEDVTPGRSYPITIRLTGIDRSNNPINLSNTFFIPVTGEGAGRISDVSITNIEHPLEIYENEDFEMSFSVTNTGSVAMTNLRVYAEMPDGILNRTNTIFIIDRLATGASQSFSITMFSQEHTNRSFPIRLAVDAGSGDSVSRFTSVFVRADATTDADGVLRPQLMVSNYSYGGSSVLAGSQFPLNLSFVNTSDRRLSNIRITLLSADGKFVPVDASNTLFVSSVEAGGTFSRTIPLRAVPAAAQGTAVITITMTYEDGESLFDAQDMISIPVLQVMRLVVDDIVPPFEVFAHTPGFSSLQFYNMGHTTLNNLMITVEGDFDVMQSNSYFVGNMEGGTSDTFSFSFIPRETGPMEGRVIFTYEDLDGVPIIHEVPFVFQVMEMPVWDDPWREMPVEDNTPWSLIIFGIAAALIIAGLIAWRYIRKARMNKRLEIEDEEFNTAFDLEKAGDDK